MKPESELTTSIPEVCNPSWTWLRAMMRVRRELGMTQAEFADAIGMSKDAVTSWECGRNRIVFTSALRMTVRLGRNILSGNAEPVDGEALIRAQVAEYERELRRSMRL